MDIVDYVGVWSVTSPADGGGAGGGGARLRYRYLHHHVILFCLGIWERWL